MKWKYFAVGSGLLVGSIASGSANACSDLLNSLIYQSVRPVVEAADLCGGLRKEFDLVVRRVTVGIDKTDMVRLTQFQYCDQGATSTLKANIFVRCKTSESAVIRTHIQEDFALDATVDNASCQITDFHAAPRGEIGRLIARNAGFQQQARQAMQDNLNLICAK